MISGNYIWDLFMSVKLEAPAMPWTTSTPISRTSCEKTMLG